MQEVQETWVPFLGQEGPLEKKTATHSSVLAWTIPWTEEPGGLQSMGVTKESDMTEQISTHTHTHTCTHTHSGQLRILTSHGCSMATSDIRHTVSL